MFFFLIFLYNRVLFVVFICERKLHPRTSEAGLLNNQSCLFFWEESETGLNSRCSDNRATSPDC